MNKKQIKEKIKASIKKAEIWYEKNPKIPNFVPKTLIMDVSNTGMDSVYCGMLFYNLENKNLSYLLPNLGEEYGRTKTDVSIEEQIDDFSTLIYGLQENVLKIFSAMKNVSYTLILFERFQ